MSPTFHSLLMSALLFLNIQNVKQIIYACCILNVGLHIMLVLTRVDPLHVINTMSINFSGFTPSKTWLDATLSSAPEASVKQSSINKPAER